MIDRIIRIFLAFSIVALAISLITRPRVVPPVLVSDNGIVPPALLKSIAARDVILDRGFEDLKLDDSHLGAAIESLAAATGTPINVSWGDLKYSMIDRAMPIHVHLHDGTLRQALHWLADDVGGYSPGFNYACEGGTVSFGVTNQLPNDMTTEFYNIRLLIEAVQSDAIRDGRRSPVTCEEASEMIIKLLTDTVDSDSWRSAGGVNANISEVGGLLIVTETPKSQREIAKLLTRLNVELKK